MAKVKITQELIKQLESEGYRVKKPADLVRKTFVLEKSVLEDFMRAVGRLDLKIQDAANDALREWTKKRS